MLAYRLMLGTAMLSWSWLCGAAYAQGEPASAQDDLPALQERLELREPMPVRSERAWYGWQTLIADVASGSVTLGLLASEGEAGAILGTLTVWMLATPVIHTAHGNLVKGTVSLLARVGGVSASFMSALFIALFTYGGDDAKDPPIGVYLIVPALAVAGIAAIDAAFLAFEERKVGADRARLLVLPFASHATRTLGLALAGSL